MKSWKVTLYLDTDNLVTESDIRNALDDSPMSTFSNGTQTVVEKVTQG